LKLLKKLNPFALKAKPKRTNSAVLKKNILLFAHELPVHQEWLDSEEIRKIDRDSTVVSAVSIRKSATLKKELIIETKSSLIKEEFEKIIDYAFKDQVLDTPLQGFSVFELNWYEKGGLLFPKPIERDYRMFGLLEERLFYNHQEVDPFKALHIIYRAKFDAPQGRPLYHTLFWLRRFKSASITFWMEFMERFGTPWIVGKTSDDPDVMAEQLYAMLGGDVAVISEEDSVELKTPDSNSKGVFKELAEYCNNQIREALTGGNLTGEVKGGSYAATKTHNDIREDIAMTDEHILTTAINKLLSLFKELNSINEDINITLKDKDDPNFELAERDYKLSQTFNGRYTFTKEYLERTYRIKLQETKPTPLLNKFLAFSEKPLPVKPQDYIEKFAKESYSKEMEETLLFQLKKILQECETYEEAYEKILEGFANFDDKKALKLLEEAIALSLLFGDAEAELE